MIELRIRSLTRNEKNRLQRGGKAFDQLAEELVADEYGLSPFTDAEWYDAVDEDSNTKYEVKSTQETVGDSYSNPGRFRLFKGQHRSLTASEGQGMAWYAFVLLAESEGVIRIQRKKPTTVTKIIRRRGGWNRSGHASKGKQHKVPISEVF